MNVPIVLSGAQAAIDEFMIHGLFSYELFGQTFWIDTSHVCTLIVMLVLIGFAIAVNIRMRRATEVPRGLQNIAEIIVEQSDKFVMSILPEAGRWLKNYIGALFMFLVFANISGLFGLRPPTADFGITLPLGLISFGWIQYYRARTSTPWEIWKELCHPLPPWLPLWLPINLISELARPMSLSLRLFANLLSGVVFMAIVYNMIGEVAYIWPAALHVAFDLFFPLIQAYVFCMLTLSYMISVKGHKIPRYDKTI